MSRLAFFGLNMLACAPKYENEVFSVVGERGGGEAKGSRRFRKSEVSAGDARELEPEGEGDLEDRGRRDSRLDPEWRNGSTASSKVRSYPTNL